MKMIKKHVIHVDQYIKDQIAQLMLHNLYGSMEVSEF